MDYIDISAKTIEEAISEGRKKLDAEQKEIVETKTMEEPSNGFLGIGKKPAVVRIFYKNININHAVNTEEASSTAVVENEVSKPVEETETTPTENEETVENTENSKNESVELSVEEIAEVANEGKEFLTGMFAKMDLPVVIEKMSSKDKITYQIHGDDVGILIGKHGQTLDAIQYLTNLVTNRKTGHRCRIVVDVENYRSRREDTLVQLAKRLASKVKHSHQKVALEPMNAYERKIIHLTLQNDTSIVTDSEGEEPYRHIVISYKR